MNISPYNSIETLNAIESRLRKNKRVFFVRFGDGEIVSMMGKDHRNYSYSPQLQKELTESFKIKNKNYLKGIAVNIPYEKGMSRGVFLSHDQNSKLIDFLTTNKLITIKTDLYSAVSFLYISAFKPELVYNFFEKYIRPVPALFIGSTSPGMVKKLYGENTKYIKIPSKNCYNSIDSWWPKVIEELRGVKLILPSAGAVSNVIAKRLWYLEKDINVLDIGSLVDALENKTTRTWIRLVGHRVQKILPAEHRNNSFTDKIKYFKKDLYYLFRQFKR
ncbi:MAG: hypothetical protein K9M56_02855 [Victivallales bacterium]|nr:hypothetical protein [Victivallales bacterium]